MRNDVLTCCAAIKLWWKIPRLSRDCVAEPDNNDVQLK